MRTIKFRVKTYKNDWCYFSIEKSMENPLFDEDLKCKPSTVGQFTGLLDKDGNEIYEGDIIHIKGNTVDKDFGVVMFHKNGYFYIDDGFGEFPRDCVKPIGDFFNDISRDDFFQGMKFYVNSNIHDSKRK